MHINEIIREWAAEQRYEHEKREQEIDRLYLRGVKGVSDRVSPLEAEAYLKAAEGVDEVKVEIDATGELCGREAPPEGHTFAVVVGDSETFWDRLNDELVRLDEQSSSPQTPDGQI